MGLMMRSRAPAPRGGRCLLLRDGIAAQRRYALIERRVAHEEPANAA
jgi:hypothetical protein